MKHSICWIQGQTSRQEQQRTRNHQIEGDSSENAKKWPQKSVLRVRFEASEGKVQLQTVGEEDFWPNQGRIEKEGSKIQKNPGYR